MDRQLSNEYYKEVGKIKKVHDEKKKKKKLEEKRMQKHYGYRNGKKYEVDCKNSQANLNANEYRKKRGRDPYYVERDDKGNIIKNTPSNNPIGWILFLLFIIFIIFCAINSQARYIHTPSLLGIIGGMI